MFAQRDGSEDNIFGLGGDLLETHVIQPSRHAAQIGRLQADCTVEAQIDLTAGSGGSQRGLDQIDARARRHRGYFRSVNQNTHPCGATAYTGDFDGLPQG